jgi:NhaA family Na+:H+ antiporter
METSKNGKYNFSFLRATHFHINGGILLMIVVLLAMLVANSPWSDAYTAFWSKEVYLQVGNFNLFNHHGHPMTLATFINDVLMTIFFFSVGLEIKREVLVGELSSLRQALLPIIAACGGMIIPVVIYYAMTAGTPAENGLAIPMATDIAFSLGILSVFKSRVPVGLKMFLAALAVADDLGGIIVIALFYSSDVNLLYLGLSALCVGILCLGNITKVRTKTFYISVGIVLWYFMLNSGIHATIAGVIVAFFVPATLKNGTGYYLERIRNNVSKFPVIEVDDLHNTIVLTNDQIHTLKSIESAADKMISPLQDLEDNLHTLINYVVVPLFAFANAGIALSGMSIGNLFSGVSLAVILGLVAGKFLGVFSFSWIAIRLKIVSLPAGASWASFASICVVCGIGFTVSMFIADLSYAGLGTDGATLLAQTKLGVLVGSVISAILGCILLHRTLPKVSD